MKTAQDKNVSVNMVERIWRHEEHFDIRLGDITFGVFSACLGSCFSPVFSHYSLLPFGIVLYTLCHYMLEVCDLLFLF